MPNTALIIITADPRTDRRAAEAIRMAAGVGAWEKVAVTLYLRDAAALALGEFTDDLTEDESYERYLPVIGDWGRPVYVQSGSPWVKQLGAARVKFEEITDTQLAVLATKNQYVLRF